MDDYHTFHRRRAILNRRSYARKLHEFGRHAGSIMIVSHSPELELGAVTFGTRIGIQSHFGSIAERMDQAVSTYYDELSVPTDGFHESNVLAAIEMASTSVELATPWLRLCVAPAKAATAIASNLFDTAKCHFGPVATSRTKLTAAELAGCSAALLTALWDIRSAADCSYRRIVA